MKLIIGGKSNGKYSYVKSLGYCDKDIAQNLDALVIYKLNDIIFSLKQDGIEYDSIKAKVMESLKNDSVIVCDEIGSGIVPIEKLHRELREDVGRICCEIADMSSSVIRVFCGIGIDIKNG